MSQPLNPPAGTGLTFTGMTHLGLAAGSDLQYNVKDNALKTYLCVGKQDNRVLVTGTTRLTRQAAVLNAIDQFGKWSQSISLWMVGEKNGCVSVRTPPVSYVSHVTTGASPTPKAITEGTSQLFGHGALPAAA